MSGERTLDAPAVALPPLARGQVDLAQIRLGGMALACSDDFFAPMERLLLPAPPVFMPGHYDDHGKWMDGWESRRRRSPGHDWCIVRLGLRGIIRCIDIDTSWFTGNYAPEASIEAADPAGPPDDATEWTEIVPRRPLAGDSHHFVEVTDGRCWTHVRLNIFPDGGVARLRVYGEVRPDWSTVAPDVAADLASLRFGGRIVACNDSHFGAPENLLAPGRGVDMGDGWETRRRREPGNDWVIVALGRPTRVGEIEVDTAWFRGNYPDRCAVAGLLLPEGGDEAALPESDAWATLLPEQALGPDTIHVFREEIVDRGPVSHVRLDIFPDGGVSRLRVRGRIADGPDGPAG